MKEHPCPQAMNIHECAVFEAGRKFGVRQAMLFLIEIHDEPTLAEEIEKYVLPSRQWRRRFIREYLALAQRRLEEVSLTFMASH